MFLLNAALFVLVGLQLPGDRGRARRRHPASSLVRAAVIAGAVIATRFVWVFPATYLPRAALARGSASATRRRRGSTVRRSPGSGCAARCRSPPRWRCR